MNEAIRDAVKRILNAMQRDLNTIPMGHDYVFYPELSKELIEISYRPNQPEKSQKSGNDSILLV